MRADHACDETKLISFSGIDGAGKSTQIAGLCRHIEQAGLRFKLIRFWDDVATFARFRETAAHNIFGGDTGTGTPSAPVNRRDKNIQSWMMTLVRLCLYLADTVSLWWLIRRISCTETEVVIFDRYIFDELANLKLQNPLIRCYVGVITGFVPKPHIAYLLDADPIQARARKPEYPLEFLCANRRAYLLLSQMVGGMTVIPPMPMHEVEQMVMTVALQELSLTLAQDHRTTNPDITLANRRYCAANAPLEATHE